MFVYQLIHRIFQQYHELIKRFDVPLQFYAIGEINRYGNPFPAQSVEKWILECMPLAHNNTSLLFVLIIIVCIPLSGSSL